mgnify:CR=1 FL=1
MAPYGGRALRGARAAMVCGVRGRARAVFGCMLPPFFCSSHSPSLVLLSFLLSFLSFLHELFQTRLLFIIIYYYYLNHGHANEGQ